METSPGLIHDEQNTRNEKQNWKILKYSSEKQLHASIHFPIKLLRLTASGKNSPVFSKFISSRAILHIYPFSALDAESDCYEEEFSHA